MSRQVVDSGDTIDGFVLIAGHHRLEACRSLGLVEIEASVVEMTELDRQLWEIDENLCRVDLTELERAEHLARRKDVYEARHPETRHGVAGAVAKHGTGADDNLSFAADTASKTGIGEREIQRAVRRATKIASDVKKRIADTEIADSGVELDALASMEAAPPSTGRMDQPWSCAGLVRDAMLTAAGEKQSAEIKGHALPAGGVCARARAIASAASWGVAVGGNRSPRHATIARRSIRSAGPRASSAGGMIAETDTSSAASKSRLRTGCNMQGGFLIAASRLMC